ncbi:MFS transporter [Pseudarthrobacter sp. H2]|uniref:MFS transporter n=1 Tax=Pseudarthrobacter sp. H2 TaxID=3418415 RepID=UPI003CFA505C
MFTKVTETIGNHNMPGNRPLSAQGLAIAILAATGMLTSLQFTLVVPSLPAMATSLDISTNDAAWLITITLLTATAGTPILTRMADMYGRRRLLLISLTLLVLGSVIAALGMTFPTALIGRALQGFATSIIPIGISLLRDQLSPERASSAIALMSATLGMGSAAGLLLSGLLSQNLGIAALFWFSAIAGTIASIGVLLTVSESGAHTGGRFDLVGAMILTIALTCILLVISKGLVWGWTSGRFLSVAAVGIVALIVWVPLQLRHPNAVIDLRTSFRRPVLQTNLATFFAAAGMFGNHLLTVHEVQAPVGTGAGLALSPINAGLTMIPAAIAMVALAPVAGLLLKRFGGRPVLALGSLIMSLSFVFRLLTHDELTTVMTGATLVGVGTALSFAAMPTLIMSYVPPTESASANGINSLVRSLSGAAASAVFALLVSVFAVSAGGAEFLSDTGLTIAYTVIAASCGIAALLAILLPSTRSESGNVAT